MPGFNWYPMLSKHVGIPWIVSSMVEFLIDTSGRQATMVGYFGGFRVIRAYRYPKCDAVVDQLE
eukprot:6188371-Pleurochrysis_carterae.AAC.3